MFHAPNNMLVFGPVTEHGVLPSRVEILNTRQRFCHTAPVSVAGLELREFLRQHFGTKFCRQQRSIVCGMLSQICKYARLYPCVQFNSPVTWFCVLVKLQNR